MSEPSEETFKKLADNAEEQTKIEDEINAIAQKKLAPVFDKRRELIKEIPKFWPAVLINSGELDEFMTSDDYTVLEHLTDFHVKYDDDKPRNFTIHFEFSENEYLETLVFDKRFEYQAGDDEKPAKYTSSPVEIKWKNNITKDDDESIFRFFEFTGQGPSEYPAEGLALILADNIYPHALKYFTGAFDDLSDGVEEEFDLDAEDDEEEEANGKDGEHEDAPPKKKAKKE